MTNKSYSDKLKSPKWQKKRLEIFKRDKWKCKLCKDEETMLHVHHLQYFDNTNPWDYDNKYLVTLCEDCHKSLEKKKDKEIDFLNIKVCKLSGWTDESKILFYHNGEETYLEIIKSNGDKLTGYILNNDVLHSISLFIKSII